FGVTSDREICEYILLNTDTEKEAELLEALRASILDAKSYKTQDDALRHLMSMVSYVPMVQSFTGNATTAESTASSEAQTQAPYQTDAQSTQTQQQQQPQEDSMWVMDEEKKREWAAYGQKKKMDFTVELINNDVFPHCRNRIQKLYMLGHMARRLLYISKGWSKADNRDSYVNKRIDLTGVSLNNLFRNYYHRMTKDMTKEINRQIKNGTWRSTDDVASIVSKSNIYKIVKPSTIKTGMIRALSTGDFSTKQANSNKVGVAQVLNRLTYQATLSHLRRINTPVDKSSEMIDPRKLHGTQWGFLCHVETPEGSSIGLVKNLSSHAHITIPGNSGPLYEYVRPFVTLIEDVASPRELYGKVKVLINGVWMGVVKDSSTAGAMAFYQNMKDKKTKGIINIYTSVVFDYVRAEI
ncbi:MAG: hypothetical protein EBU92_14625, partial [Betaproteobacteria bacterium]|nr:hypothetical protein [Betaproteobacteria bacterium]